MGFLFGLGALRGSGQDSSGMPANTHPSFEVATIKLSDPESGKQGIDSKGHRVILLGQTLTNMIASLTSSTGARSLVGHAGYQLTDTTLRECQMQRAIPI